MKQLTFLFLNIICLTVYGQKRFAIIPKIGLGAEIITGSDKIAYLPFTSELQVRLPFFHATAQAYYYRTLSNNFDPIPNVINYEGSAALVFGKAETSLLLGGFYSLNNRSYGIDYSSSSGEYDFSFNSIYIQNLENGKEWTQTAPSAEKDVRVHFTKSYPYFGAGLGLLTVSPSKKDRDFITLMFYFYWAPKLDNAEQTIIHSPYQINVPIEYSIQGLKYHSTGVGLDLKYNFYQFGLNMKMGTKPNIYVVEPGGDKMSRFERGFQMSIGFFLTF
jgi:hypothetical protein